MTVASRGTPGRSKPCTVSYAQDEQPITACNAWWLLLLCHSAGVSASLQPGCLWFFNVNPAAVYQVPNANNLEKGQSGDRSAEHNIRFGAEICGTGCCCGCPKVRQHVCGVNFVISATTTLA